MKKLAALISIVILLCSCGTTKQVTEQPKAIEAAPEKPIVWKQAYYPTISLKDSVLFYNSTEIKLSGEFFNKSFFVKDGIVNVIDSINSVAKIVPEVTAGGFVDMKKLASGEIVGMEVSFSKNEATYKFIFMRVNDGSFILNNKATLIYHNKKYPVNANTNGDCTLMFYYNKQEVRLEDQSKAEGWKQY